MKQFYILLVVFTLITNAYQNMIFDTPTHYEVRLADNKNHNCKCGLFKKIEDIPTGEPFLVHAPLKVTCDHQGDVTCLIMCRNIGNYIRGSENGQAIMCAGIGNSDKPAVPATYFKSCASKWNFVPLNIKKLLENCCKDGKVAACGN